MLKRVWGLLVSVMIMMVRCAQTINHRAYLYSLDLLYQHCEEPEFYSHLLKTYFNNLIHYKIVATKFRTTLSILL